MRLVFIGLLFFSSFVSSNSWEHLFESPQYTDVKISPNGKLLAVKGYVENKLSLFFVDLAKNKVVNVVRLTGDQQVGSFYWVNDERVVMGIVYQKPWVEELQNYGELFAIDYDGDNGRLLYGFRAGEMQTGSNIRKKQPIKGWGEILDVLPEDDRHVLIVSTPMSDGGERLSTIYKLNVYSGRLSQALKAPMPYTRFVTNSKGEVALATGIDKNFMQQVFLRQGDNWKQLSQSEFGSNFTPLTIDKTGNHLYVLDNYKQDKIGLFKFNLKTTEYKKVYTDKAVDVTNVSRTVDGRSIYALRVDDGLPAYLIINKDYAEAEVFKMLATSFPGNQVDIRSHTRSGDKYIVSISSDTDPGAFYLYDRTSNNLSLVFSKFPQINNQALVATQPFQFKASDDLDITGYITLAESKSEKKPPLVVLVHGGPHARDYWGFSAQVQYLVKNGYSVMQVNFRGSTGFGKRFESKGYTEWGNAIQRDIYESLQWAIENNKVDEGNACIMGASFGAYSAVQSAINYPQAYRCAIANAGVYDLPLLFKDGDVKDLKYGKSYLNLTLGNNKEQLEKNSPVNRVSKISTPLLLAHGEEDERAPFEHVERLKNALDDANKSYQWFVLEDESHGFHHPENQKLYMKNVLAFLDKHLKS